MSFFTKIFSAMVQDAAVQRLANNKTFQQIAVRTVDAVSAGQKMVEETAKKTAENPAAAAAAVQDGAATFWGHLKAEAQKDWAAWTSDAAPPPQSKGSAKDPRK